MVTTLLSFLAFAFMARAREEADLDENVDAARRRFALDTTKDQLREMAWFAYDLALYSYRDDEDEPTPEEEYSKRVFSDLWSEFLLLHGKDAKPVDFVKWDEMMEAGQKPPGSRSNSLPPGMEFTTELVRSQSYRWQEAVEFSDRCKLPIANEFDADYAEALFLLHLDRFTLIAVWSNYLEEALEEAAGWAADHAPGVFVQPEYPADEDGNPLPYEGNEEAYRQAEMDLTYTESGYLDYTWGLIQEIRNPFRGRYRSTKDFKTVDPAEARVWLAYWMRSADIDEEIVEAFINANQRRAFELGFIEI